MAHQHRHDARLALGIGAFAIGAIAAAALQNRRNSRGADDSAPGRTARHGWGRKFGDYTVIGKTVTINRPREELFAFWRDFQNLPTFMENIEKVEETGDGRTIWTISAPGGQSVRVETKIAEERENELVAWRSVEGSDIDTEGRVAFRDAPGGRGTLVEAIISYKPPAGALGRAMATLFQKEPAMQARREMKRFKMLMETGELANPANRRETA